MKPVPIDLFGNPDPTADVVISEYTGKEKRVTKRGGYAARPGSGPEGETCKTCNHATRTSGGGSRFYKCGVVRHRWTHGPGSDIRLSSPACSLWEKFVEPIPPAGFRWLRVNEVFCAGDIWVKDGKEDHPMCKELIGRRCDKDCEYLVARRAEYREAGR